jgi:hypothetical protein
LCLVHGMYCDPPQRALASLWVVVNNCAIPVVGGQSGEDIAEHLCRVPELAGHILGLLLGIPVVHDSLVTSRRETVRLIHAAGRKYPLALDEQHVAQMAAILQRRPHTGLPPRSQVDVAGEQYCHDLSDPRPNLPLNCR